MYGLRQRSGNPLGFITRCIDENYPRVSAPVPSHQFSTKLRYTVHDIVSILGSLLVSSLSLGRPCVKPLTSKPLINETFLLYSLGCPVSVSNVPG